MTGTNRTRLVALLLLAAAAAARADDDPPDVAWKVDANAILLYKVTPAAAMPDPKPAGRDLRVFGFQVLPRGAPASIASEIAEAADPIVLAMPPARTKLGGRWRTAYAFVGIRNVSEFEIRGAYRLKGWTTVGDKKFLEVDGIFEAAPLKRGKSPNPPGYRFRSGKMTMTSRIDPEAGRVEAATADYVLTFDTDGGNVDVAGKMEYALAEAWLLPDGEFQPAVDKAVEKGVAWLKSKQLDDGSFQKNAEYEMGYSAISLLALLKSGVPRFDPVVYKGFERLKTLDFTKTYSVALLILALEARHAPSKENPVNGQTAVAAGQKIRIPDDDLEWMRRATKWLVDNRATNGLWHYPTNGGAYDFSNTQYAVLALKTASRCGIEVAPEVWTKIAEQFLDAQEKEGPTVGLDRFLAGSDELYAGRHESIPGARARGWGYVAAQEAYGSMTTAGVACLVLAESGLFESNRLDRNLRGRIDGSVREGIAWLEHHYSVFENPGSGGWYHYYLYGLERAMILSGTHTLGGREWYKDGSRILIKLQEGGGDWGPNSIDGTCFALLFLRRATTPVAVSTGD